VLDVDAFVSEESEGKVEATVGGANVPISNNFVRLGTRTLVEDDESDEDAAWRMDADVNERCEKH